MFNSKLFFSLAVFTFFLIITSLVKNQSRIIEKQIKSLNIKIVAKEKNISEAEMEFSYLSSPNEIEKKFNSKDLEKFEPIKHSNIFYDVDDFNTLEKKLSNLINIDEKNIISSTGALSLKSVPKKLAVIGGGYIGLEMGSVWSRLGSDVTVIEYLDHITPGMDKEISTEFMKILKKQGIKFNMQNKVEAIQNNGSGAVVSTVDKDGNKNNFDCDVVLISVGRKANTNSLNLGSVGVELDKRKRVKTDKAFKTNIDNIYAIGDVISGPMLAHKAEDEGIAVAENIAGQSGHVNYDTIPGVVYTTPEVASIGKTEEQLKELNTNYKIGKFSFMANSRAKAIDDAEGFVKILADEKTDKVLGAHIIGPHAGELIAEIGVAMEFGASSEDIARTCHAHPTFSEAVKEAALSVDKRAIHS